MKVITIGNSKGGTGKSTIAGNLAVCAAHDGKRVVLIDADPQASSMTFRALRAELHDLNDISAVAVTTPTLHRDLATYNADLLIIDTGGRDSVLFRSALMAASGANGLVIIPALPSPYDFWATSESLDTLAEARSYADINARILLNQCQANTVMLRETEESLADLTASYDISPMFTKISHRTAFKNAAAKGRGVIEDDPKGRGAEEITALYEEIKNILGGF